MQEKKLVKEDQVLWVTKPEMRTPMQNGSIISYNLELIILNMTTATIRIFLEK